MSSEPKSKNWPWIVAIVLSMLMVAITLTPLTAPTLALAALKYATAALFAGGAGCFLLCLPGVQRLMEKGYTHTPKRWVFVVAASICLFLGFYGLGNLPPPPVEPPSRNASGSATVGAPSNLHVPSVSMPKASSSAAPPAPAVEAQNEAPNWTYREETDPMRGTTTRFAETESINALNFDFPYQGGKARLTIRKRSQDDVRVMLAIDGQFQCNQFRDDVVAVKFDDGAIEHYPCAMPRDGTANVLFVRGEARFMTKLKRANVLVIETEFFQEGRRQLFFDVSGIKEQW